MQREDENWSSREEPPDLRQAEQRSFLARFRDILAFFCMKSQTNSLCEKKNRTSNFSHFTAAKSLLRTCRPFRDIRTILHGWFRIIFAPLFLSYTIAGSFSTASRCVLSEFCSSDNLF